MKFICTDKVDVPHLLIMEYLPLGNLRELINLRPCHWMEVAPLMLQFLRGLDHLHTRNVAHLAIKPENILLAQCEPYYKAKFGDLGLAREGSSFSTPCGTPLYASPEMLAEYPCYNSKSDIWSAGVVIYELLAGSLPKTTLRQKQGTGWHRLIVTSAREFFAKPDSLDDVAFTDMSRILLNHMLRINPERRSSAWECLLEGTRAPGGSSVFGFVEREVYSAGDETHPELNSTEEPLGLDEEPGQDDGDRTDTGVEGPDWVKELADKEIEDAGVESISEFVPSIDGAEAYPTQTEATSLELDTGLSSADGRLQDVRAASSVNVIRSNDEPRGPKNARNRPSEDEDPPKSFLSSSPRDHKRQKTHSLEDATTRPAKGAQE